MDGRFEQNVTSGILSLAAGDDDFTRHRPDPINVQAAQAHASRSGSQRSVAVHNPPEAAERADRGNNNEMSQTSAAEGFGRVGGPGERPGSIAASSVYSDDLARGEGQPWGPTGDDADPFTASYTNEEGERFPSEIQPLRVGLAGQPGSGLKRFSALQNYSYPATSARHQSILRDYSAWAAERGPGHDDEGWSNWDYEEARANDLRIYGEEDSGEGPSGEQSDSYESIYACSSPDPGEVSPSGEPQALPQPTRAHQHHQESADSSRLLPPRADLQGRDDSPLDQYMPVEAQAGPSASRRTGTKNLFGDGGWLADTSSSAQQTPAQKKLEKITGPRRSPTKSKSRFLGGFMKKARGIVESPSRTFGPPLRRSPASMPQPPRSGEEPPTPPLHILRQSQLVISLNPREQSLIYCELDFAIADALNDYIMSQFNLGRVDHATIKKTADEWAKKGLPKVKGFRYDVDTQLSILRAHIEQFKFYGQAATTVPSMLGIIDTMRTTAREMRLRTYCVPDVVISKWL
ncbi:hypothetical protein QC761_309490 [Podospora bellae-mahoneyi]|uniref:Uncharacterized protein n=1 Tax=Podospora bellae-mahoneyi TaxID=2093777 RepID=A0ABR0FLX5_9PEZI|nr:hypothetical protein QC761_309490 [Podospora bellae-mahoneyi]